MKSILNEFVVMPVIEEDRQVVVTKELRKPMDIIRDKVDRVIKGIEGNDDLKYMMYSSHDDTMANTLMFLKPYNFNFV